MSDRSPASVARSYLASFAGGDPDVIAGHVAGGFVNEHASALGRGSTGGEEYRSRLPGFLASLPGLRYDVASVIADGGRVAVEYRLTATSDGHPIDVRGAMVLDVADGLITRRTDYWDSLTYLRQTGAAI
jgi:ketosteroid isomerase-like protein